MDKRLIGECYELERKLGEGSFGETWRARDLSRAGMPVVVKISRAGQGARLAHTRELAAIRQLPDVPHIARVVCHGGDDDRAWIAYEWIEGRDLAAVLGTGPLPLPVALPIARALAEALAALHARGFIHRDLKPSNVLLPAHPERDGPAVLLDFGLAGALRVETQTTAAGQIFGTPAYMSPEQVTGRPQSAAADVYGLGMLLFEMLYGRPPFVPGSVMALFESILQEPVSIPDTPKVPPAVRDLLLRCLAKEPAQRPADGVAVLALLDALDDRKGPAATGSLPIGVPQVQPPAPREHRLGQALLPLAVVAVLFAAACAFILLHAGPWRPGRAALRILAGGALVTAGLFGAVLTRRFLRGRKRGLPGDTAALFGRTMGRQEMFTSIALDLGLLLERCRQLDDRILGRSISLMVAEYEQATDSDDRQKALMNAMTLLEKLSQRLAPWYVRNDKLIPALVGLVGVISGIASAALGLLGKGPH